MEENKSKETHTADGVEPNRDNTNKSANGKNSNKNGSTPKQASLKEIHEYIDRIFRGINTIRINTEQLIKYLNNVGILKQNEFARLNEYILNITEEHLNKIKEQVKNRIGKIDIQSDILNGLHLTTFMKKILEILHIFDTEIVMKYTKMVPKHMKYVAFADIQNGITKKDRLNILKNNIELISKYVSRDVLRQISLIPNTQATIMLILLSRNTLGIFNRLYIYYNECSHVNSRISMYVSAIQDYIKHIKYDASLTREQRDMHNKITNTTHNQLIQQTNKYGSNIFSSAINDTYNEIMNSGLADNIISSGGKLTKGNGGAKGEVNIDSGTIFNLAQRITSKITEKIANDSDEQQNLISTSKQFIQDLVDLPMFNKDMDPGLKTMLTSALDIIDTIEDTTEEMKEGEEIDKLLNEKLKITK